MYQVANDKLLKEAAIYLAKHDRFLATIIARVGICDITPQTKYYQRLVTSIIGQQLSVKAANSIRKKFVALFGGTFPSPELILEKSVEELRTAGLSNAKSHYIQGVATHVLDGRLKFDKIESLSNDKIIAELTAVKGIGEWTAHMFLMFTMGRMDVLPVGDLGIKNGIQKLYGLKKVPMPNDIHAIAVKYRWHPYESVASWYIWQSLDNEPK